MTKNEFFRKWLPHLSLFEDSQTNRSIGGFDMDKETALLSKDFRTDVRALMGEEPATPMDAFLEKWSKKSSSKNDTEFNQDAIELCAYYRDRGKKAGKSEIKKEETHVSFDEKVTEESLIEKEHWIRTADLRYNKGFLQQKWVKTHSLKEFEWRDVPYLD